MAMNGRNQKHIKDLGKFAQGKNLLQEYSDKIDSDQEELEMSSESIENDMVSSRLMSNLIKDAVNQLSVHYEEKMEQAVERAAKMAAMKVVETINKENSNLEKQVEDKDEKIARLESEKDHLLNANRQNEVIIKQNQEKIDTLTQEKKKMEIELLKQEKEFKEQKEKIDIEKSSSEELRKKLADEIIKHTQTKCKLNHTAFALKKKSMAENEK